MYPRRLASLTEQIAHLNQPEYNQVIPPIRHLWHSMRICLKYLTPLLPYSAPTWTSSTLRGADELS